MPVGMGLKCSPCLDNRKIVTGSAHKLQSYRETLLSESARNGHCRQPANIANATEWVGKDETGLEIQRQRRRWNGLGSRCKHVKHLE